MSGILLPSSMILSRTMGSLDEAVRTVLGLLNQAPRERRESSHRLRTILPAIGARYEVRTVCLIDGQYWGTFAMFRTGAAPDFFPAETAVLHAVSVPLAAGCGGPPTAPAPASTTGPAC